MCIRDRVDIVAVGTDLRLKYPAISKDNFFHFSWLFWHKSVPPCLSLIHIWTPWQMFAMGFIGFLSGILYRIGLLPTKRLRLCIYGFLVTVFIYGGIMNPAALFMSVYDFTWEGLLAIYISGIPVDLVHALSLIHI